MVEEVDVKIINEYEGFLEKKLIPKLSNLVKDRDKLIDEINGYIDLENLLLEQNKNHKEDSNAIDHGDRSNDGKKDYRTLIDIGGGIKMQAKVDSKQLSFSSSDKNNDNIGEIYIHIGLGYHIPLSASQCLDVILQRVPLLEEKLKTIQDQCNAIVNDIENSKALILEAKAHNRKNTR